MANLNKVMLIGRLTRDPEVRTFSNGGKVAKFGFAVDNRKKNKDTGEWEKVPCFLDIEVFNQEKRKLADLVEQYLKKGHQAYIEGSLHLNQWTADNGEKRSKLLIVMDNVEFLEPRKDGEGGGPRSSEGRSASQPARKPASAPPAEEHYDEPHESAGGGDQDIPF